jgi:hypothetical protein
MKFLAPWRRIKRNRDGFVEELTQKHSRVLIFNGDVFGGNRYNKNYINVGIREGGQ